MSPRRIFTLACAFLLVTGTLLGALLGHQHAVALRDGERLTASLTQLVAEQTTRSLQTVQQALELAASRLAELEAGGQLNEQSARSALREQVRGLPYVRAIWTLDAQGVIRRDSDVGNIGISLADREYFRVYGEHADTGFFLGRPVRSRSVGTWLVSAALPLHRRGVFDGIIVAAIQPPYFERLWGTMDLGRHGSIALFRRDGALLMRSPYVEAAMGRSFADSPSFAPLRQKAAGTIELVSSVDGMRRIVSFRQLAQYPQVVVAVGESYDVLLAPWWRAVELGFAAWCLVALAIAVLCRQLIRESERRRHSEERSVQSQKIEAIGTLAGGIAHDFNNILGGILGNVALARNALDQGHAAHDYLGEIHKASGRARALVQQILSFSREQPHELVDVEVGVLVDETLDLLRATLPSSLQLLRRFPSQPVHVRGDFTRLQQVVMNLCTNAWRALPEGVGEVEVGFEAVTVDAAAARRLGGLVPGRHLRLWVRDTGCGIPEDVVKRIFEPFFTTRAKTGGTGLGLSVVHRIVVAHHGAITVDSRVGIGTTFEVHLPCLPADARPCGVSGNTVESARPVDGAGRCVLVVDDDDVVRLMIERVLQNHGFIVHSHAHPEAALAALRADAARCDAVVTDQDMPGMSGVALAAELARLRPGLPVLLSSGYATEELLAEAQVAGVRELLHKETVYQELPLALARVLALDAQPTTPRST